MNTGHCPFYQAPALIRTATRWIRHDVCHSVDVGRPGEFGPQITRCGHPTGLYVVTGPQSFFRTSKDSWLVSSFEKLLHQNANDDFAELPKDPVIPMGSQLTFSFADSVLVSGCEQRPL